MKASETKKIGLSLLTAALLTGCAVRQSAADALPAPSNSAFSDLSLPPAGLPAEKADLFPLAAVRLGDSPFKEAQKTDRAYLLRLNPDRLLAWDRTTAGLTPKAPHYGGWDNGGASTIGHYLSACSQMAQATGTRCCESAWIISSPSLPPARKRTATAAFTPLPGTRKLTSLP